MSENEIKREQPSFEVRAESLKKRTKEFFSTYENPNGSEDRLEICLIREGYRAVLMAEEEINRQKAEIERLKDILYDADGVNLVNYWHQQCKIAENGCRNFAEENETLKAEIEGLNNTVDAYKRECNKLSNLIPKARAEAVKEFAERLKEKATPHYFDNTHFAVKVEEIDNLLKERVGES